MFSKAAPSLLRMGRNLRARAFLQAAASPLRVASRKAAEGCSSCLGGHESGGRFGRLAARSASSLAVGTPCGCNLKCEGHRDTNRTAVSSLPTRVVRASLVKALRKKGSDDLAPRRSLPHSPCWGGRSRVASFCSRTFAKPRRALLWLKARARRSWFLLPVSCLDTALVKETTCVVWVSRRAWATGTMR